MREEALADIVAEMRTRSREVKEAFGGRPDGVENMLDIWADRIEAAWKRQEKTYLDQIRDAMNMWGHEKHIAEHAQKPTVGNAAAMREALEKLIAYWDWNGFDAIRESQLKDMARAALAVPRRNCDVGTPEEQTQRMHAQLCSKQKSCYELPSGEHCPMYREGIDCRLAWAQMPYKA